MDCADSGDAWPTGECRSGIRRLPPAHVREPKTPDSSAGDNGYLYGRSDNRARAAFRDCGRCAGGRVDKRYHQLSVPAGGSLDARSFAIQPYLSASDLAVGCESSHGLGPACARCGLSPRMACDWGSAGYCLRDIWRAIVNGRAR